MAEKPIRKIYWIGGNLSRTERTKEWVPYGAQIQEHYRKMGGEDSGYEYVWVSRCTVKQFTSIWKDPNTYGIFWYSHGEAISSSSFTGYPLAYSMYLDESWRGVPRGEQWNKMKLDPQKLPAPSPNLKFIAIKSCGSAKIHDKWQQKAPGVTVVTHQGQLFRRESSRHGNFDQMLNWAKKRSGYLLEKLPKLIKQTGGGCDCNFGLREYWTSAQSSSHQTGPNLVYQKQYYSHKDITPTNPLRKMWDQGNRTGTSTPPPLTPSPFQRPSGLPNQVGVHTKFNIPRPIQTTPKSDFGTGPTGQPKQANPYNNPLRNIWDRGIGSSSTPSSFPNQGRAGNPIRQMRDQGNQPGGQFHSSFQNRTQHNTAQNPLRQMWDKGNNFR